MFYAAVVLILAGTVGQPASGEGSSGDDLGSGDLLGSGDSGGAFMWPKFPSSFSMGITIKTKQ